MSLLKPKFTYSKLSRTSVEGRRLYTTPGGQAVPSVTTVLDATKPAKKVKALKEWRDRVGHERAQRITTESASRGTRMHSYLEYYVENGHMKDRGTNPFSWCAHAMAQTVIEQGLKNVDEVWGVEVGLYHPGLYAGTTDCVGVHTGDEAILDYKQTNKFKKKEWIEDYFLQLAAYSEAHNEVFGTKIRKGVVLMCIKPEIDDQHNIVKPPVYQEFILEGDEYENYRQAWWNRLEQYYLQL